MLSLLRRAAVAVERHLEGDAALLDEALADIRRLGDGSMPCLRSTSGTADAGALEQQRGFHGARADDHLAAGPHVASPRPGVDRRDAGDAAAVEQQPGGAGAGGDGEAAAAPAASPAAAWRASTGRTNAS